MRPGMQVSGTSLEALMARYPHLAWDTKGLAKDYNADVRLDLSAAAAQLAAERAAGGGAVAAGQVSVKFHCQPLEEVIAYEQSLKPKQ